MGQFFKETAHLKTDKSAFDEGWDRIFGKKEAKIKEAHFKVVDGEVIEISEEEAIKNTKHSTAGLCGEFGMSTFDEKAYKENFDRIQWNKNNQEETKES